jgi:hypothetical protein
MDASIPEALQTISLQIENTIKVVLYYYYALLM